MRYIIDKRGLEILNIVAQDAQTELAKPVIIDDNALSFKHLDYASVILTEEQLAILKEKSIFVEEQSYTGELLAGDYEKVRSVYIKNPKTLTTGSGCKVAVMDTGFAVDVCTPFAAVNFADNTAGVSDYASHGNFVASIIKSAVGLANGCELHVLKFIKQGGIFDESAALAALDYCITHHIDIVNMSFTFSSSAFNTAIQTLMNADCVVVASSGNSTFETTILSPAGEPRVVAVNALTEDGLYPYKNVIPYNGKGVTIACSGYGCQGINTIGGEFTSNGTSFASPFFVGVFANYHQRLRAKAGSNFAVLQHILDKAVKLDSTLYAGNGRPTF